MNYSLNSNRTTLGVPLAFVALLGSVSASGAT
jgi:hypothetical protein